MPILTRKSSKIPVTFGMETTYQQANFCWFFCYCHSSPMRHVILPTLLLHYCIRVSEDADVSEDEDDNQSEDKYEDSFIDDQATPTEFTQTEQGGRHNGDMMGFYRYYQIIRQLIFGAVLE